MDVEASRRARRKKIARDLRHAMTDEEACPPEWVDLQIRIERKTAGLLDLIDAETRRFVSEHDIRAALRRREGVRASVAGIVDEINAAVRRLNLLAPLPRFQRKELDAVKVVRPLYRARRSPDAYESNTGGRMPSAPSTRGPGTPLNS